MEHKNFKNRVGEKYKNKQGYEIEVIEYFGAFNSTIKFNDNTILYNISYQQISKGTIENPNHTITYGVGYMGIGEFYAKKDGVMTKCYTKWSDMLGRCYSKRCQEKQPTYKGVSVCDDWKCFQNFAKWYYSNYVEDFHLDKDIICPDCKIYSPETCCFVPQEINVFFISTQSVRTELPLGVTKHKNKFRARYGRDRKHIGLFSTLEDAFFAVKNKKEQHAKEMAEKYKSVLPKLIYDILVNYEMKITD